MADKGNPLRDLNASNPVGDYLQDRGRSYVNDAGWDALQAALWALTSGNAVMIGSIPGAAIPAGMSLMKLRDAMNNNDSYFRMKDGQQMWSNSGMPGRPMAPMPDVNPYLKGE